MRYLQIIIDAGEKTCARAPGKWCRFMGSSHLGSNPLCLLFRDAHGEHRQLRDENNGVEGWLQRLPECIVAEQSIKAPKKQRDTKIGRHDKLFTSVVQRGDNATKLVDRLTVESFGWPSGYEREIVAFRKLRTDARLAAAMSFLRRCAMTK